MRREVIGDCTLYLGDCLDVLPTLEGVDAVVTDPPYGAVTHAGARGGAGGTILVDFASIDILQFKIFAELMVAVARRWVVMTCEWRHAASIESQGLPLIRLGVWIKPNGAPQFTGDRPGTGWEAVAILHRPGKKKWNGGGHHAVWTCNIEQGKHPTQKPLRLVKEWVELFSDHGETVLDPFMGSGTTGVACVRTGRRFVGVEKEPKYFEIACQRIRAEYARSELFADIDAMPDSPEFAFS